MDESVLDVDQVENLIKFCPTKEDMELLKVNLKTKFSILLTSCFGNQGFPFLASSITLRRILLP